LRGKEETAEEMSKETKTTVIEPSKYLTGIFWKFNIYISKNKLRVPFSEMHPVDKNGKRFKLKSK